MFQLYESTTNPEILILCERWALFSRAPALAPLPIFVPSAASPQQTGKAIAYMKTSIRNISNIFLNCFDCNLAAGDKELSQLKKLSQLCGPSVSTDACFQSEKSYTICFCLPFWLCLLIRIPESDVSLVLYFSVAGVITLRVINQSVVQWCLASTLPVSQDLGKKTATNFLFFKKILRVILNSPSLKKDANQAYVLTHRTVSPRGWHKDQTRPWITNPSSLLLVKVYSVGQKKLIL